MYRATVMLALRGLYLPTQSLLELLRSMLSLILIQVYAIFVLKQTYGYDLESV